MTTEATVPATPDELARRLAATVRAHPSVARLDGGAYGAVLTHLPGERLVGVRIGTAQEPIEIAVVLHLDRPIPQTVAELRAAVATVHDGPVDITVADVEPPTDRWWA